MGDMGHIWALLGGCDWKAHSFIGMAYISLIAAGPAVIFSHITRYHHSTKSPILNKKTEN
jgi:hypothetical protein